MPKHLVIPDTQVKDGVPLAHLSWCGEYIVEKKPDTIIMIGDWADMPSLSQYDVGQKSYEGRRYQKDIEVAITAMILLLDPMMKFNLRARKNKEKQYHPRMILTLGNHENRINRAIESDPKLEGTIGVGDLKYSDFGWEVIPFLEPIIVDGIAYCHYFTTGIMGRPVTTASALLAKKHQSCIMGHVQGRQIAFATKADGTQITGIFAGGFYQHDEEYLYAQGNAQTWRGVWMLHEVNNGSFDEMPVSLSYLRNRYG